METDYTAEEANENPIMQIRAADVDIIKGASDTNAIEKMQKNVAESDQNSNSHNILEVNNGGQENQVQDLEPINEFDQNEFYTHDHFEQKGFSEKNRSSESLENQEISGTASMSERVEEEKRDQSES